MTRPKELRAGRSSRRAPAGVAGRRRGRPPHGRARSLALEAASATLYAVMLQTRDGGLLFHEVCRVLVQQGALPAASVCVIDEPSGRLTAIASAGKAAEPDPRRARRTAAFPLLCDGVPVAILRVQFPSAASMQPAALDQLERLAGNLSIALDNIELERARSRVEETLQAAALRLRDSADAHRFLAELINAVPAPISVKDSAHRYVAVNDAFCRLLGATAEQILGREDADLVTPDMAARAMQNDDMALAGGRPVEYEAAAVFQDRPHWLFVRKSALRRDDGSLVVVSVLTDLTQRRDTEQALRESETRFRDFTSAASEFVWETDLEGRFTYVSSRAESVWGYTQGELLGRAPADFGAPGERERVRQWLARNTQADGSFRDLEYRIVNRDGEERWLLINAVGVFDETGRRVGQRGAGHDITDRKQAEARINHLATRDALTDLPNRVLLHDRLQQALASARRQGCTVAVVFIDLDRFKNINDSLGHEVGDRLLREVAARLSACLRETDTLARLGGDEFVAVVDGLKDAAEASGVGDKILRALAAPFTVGEHALVSTASLGVSLFPADAEDAATLMRNADTAMYHAKAAGRNRLQFFSADMNHRAMERHGIESALRTALEARQLRLWYQPQVELASDRPVAAEALLRWQHPELGAVPPAKFIPIAEESGLIGPIGDWVLERACEQLRAWGGACELRLSLNLSIGQLRDSRGFLDRARAIIRASGLDPARLEFEITETLLASNVAEHARVLRALGDLGCSIAVDDFGTGYSSLSYLKRLPIDTVKIDRVFVRDIVSDPDDAAIVGAVVAMARKLELAVVAEGVETVPQLRLLRELGCDRYQGYVFSPAVPPEEFAEKFLAPATSL